MTGSSESVGAKSAPILTGWEAPEADGELPPEPEAHPVSPRVAATMTAPSPISSGRMDNSRRVLTCTERVCSGVTMRTVER